MTSLEGHWVQLPDGRWCTVVREVYAGGLLVEIAYVIDGQTEEHRLYVRPRAEERS